MTHRPSRFLVIICLLLSALIAVGCSQSPQEKYNDALSKLSDAKQSRNQAKQKVADAQKQVDKDQQKLQQAQKKFRQAQQKVVTARQAVNKTVNDDVLFRTLQKKLLDDDKFSQAAISVGVHHRVVTLTGTVPDPQTRKRAEQVVHEQAGVARIDDQLEITQKKDDVPSANAAANHQGQ